MAYSAGVVTVASTATAIVPVGIGAGGVQVTNTGSNTVYLGGSGVTSSGATQGYPLAASAALTVPISHNQDETLYGITASATSTVVYLLPGAAD